jgi:hypothetical protein
VDRANTILGRRNHEANRIILQELTNPEYARGEF